MMPMTRCRVALVLPVAVMLASCGGGAPQGRPASTATPAAAIVDPAALYCAGSGGTVISATAGGRRADLCRMPDGRTVRAADLLNSHNDL